MVEFVNIPSESGICHDRFDVDTTCYRSFAHLNSFMHALFPDGECSFQPDDAIPSSCTTDTKLVPETLVCVQEFLWVPCQSNLASHRKCCKCNWIPCTSTQQPQLSYGGVSVSIQAQNDKSKISFPGAEPLFLKRKELLDIIIQLSIYIPRANGENLSARTQTSLNQSDIPAFDRVQEERRMFTIPIVYIIILDMHITQIYIYSCIDT